MFVFVPWIFPVFLEAADGVPGVGMNATCSAKILRGALPS